MLDLSLKYIDTNDSLYYLALRVFANVCAIDFLKKELHSGVDCVINLAVAYRDDVEAKSLYDEVNVGGAENACTVCTELG